MLPDSFWKNPNHVVADTACKSGIILQTARNLFIKNLSEQFGGRNEAARHSLRKQICGIATSRLAQDISVRTVYDGMDPETFGLDSHGLIRFNPSMHSFNGYSCIHCGASAAFEEDEMALEILHCSNPKSILPLRPDAVISSPVFQMFPKNPKGRPNFIYHQIMKKNVATGARYIAMMLSARWMSGGRFDISQFRNYLASCGHVRRFDLFEDASLLFPASVAHLKGGICCILFDRKWHSDECIYRTYTKDGLAYEKKRRLGVQVKGDWIVSRDDDLMDIVQNKILPNADATFDSIMQTAFHFGLNTNFDGGQLKPFKNCVTLYTKNGTRYVGRDQIPRNADWIDKLKIFLNEAYGCGVYGKDRIKYMIGDRGTAATGTFIPAGIFKTRDEIESAASYLSLPEVSACVGLLKNTQHASRKTYSMLPLPDFSTGGLWTSERFCRTFGLSERDRKLLIEKFKINS